MGFNKQVLYIFLFSLTFFVQNSISDPEEVKIASVDVKRYDLTITTKSLHFTDENKDEKFEGAITITFSTKDKDATQIVLDASSEMKLTDVKLNDVNVTKKEIKNNKLSIEAKNIKSDGENTLKIKYFASFGKDMTGIYRSSYKDDKKKNRWIVTSHFEPIFARNAFPCFDNPQQKAIFKLKVVIPSELQGYNVLSNTPCSAQKSNYEEETPTTKTFDCEETPKMSTYLLAFTISDLSSTKKEEFETSNKNKITLQTYGQKEMISYGGDLSQRIAKEAILKLEEYLKEPYTLKKVDQVGVPDFSAGAMENWGLILFRETKLFFNETRDSLLTKQSIILTIIHELVHQWFGNLVTLESWDYIWLNEAFATYFQYFIANQFRITDPKIQDWDTVKQQVVNEIHLRAFETDGLTSSKSMSHKIDDEKLIFSFFNDISYSKGSAVLRMWDLTLGQDKFKQALQSYIQKRKFNSANPSQLFEALKETCKMEKSYFDSWTTNPGYPVVNVVKTKNTYTLSQNRFLFEKPKEESKLVYKVPLNYYTSEAKNETLVYLDSENLKIQSDKEKWIIFNINQAGYYRVNYDESNWNALATALTNDRDKIEELNRAQIINDVFSLARSNQKEYVKYVTALNLAKYLKNETSYVVWKTALHSFDFLRTKLFGKTQTYSEYEKYLLDIIKPHFKGLKTIKGSHTEILKTIEIAKWACSLGYKNCTDEALDLYNKNNRVPDTLEIVFCTAVRLKKEAFEEVFKLYTTETDNIFKNMYLNALGCSENSTAILELLKKSILDSSEFRKQDLIYLMSSVINGNMNNVKTVFKFIKEKFQEISEKYGGIDPLGRALVGIAKKLNSESDSKEFEELVNKVKSNDKTKSSSENADIALNIVKNNVNWLKEKNNQLFKYFYSSSSVISCSIGLLLASLLVIFNF